MKVSGIVWGDRLSITDGRPRHCGSVGRSPGSRWNVCFN